MGCSFSYALHLVEAPVRGGSQLLQVLIQNSDSMVLWCCLLRVQGRLWHYSRVLDRGQWPDTARRGCPSSLSALQLCYY